MIIINRIDDNESIKQYHDYIYIYMGMILDGFNMF